MTDDNRACYRDRNNGVYYQRQQHRHDCDDADCRGCAPCVEANHCTALRNCSWHVATGEVTCGRCLSRTRTDIAQIVEKATLMLPEAVESGVNAEAANLAGPAADYETFSARRRIDKRWIEKHIPEHKRLRALVSLLPDDDELHPYSVLTRWEFMLREDYGHERTTPTSISAAADYLGRVLHRVAHDDEQDFALFAREIRKCRAHMESALHDSRAAERGAPCPTCRGEGHFVRLQREYAHWCDDPTCERIHYDTAEGDEWVCPRDRTAHRWTEKRYRDYVEERRTLPASNA